MVSYRYLFEKSRDYNRIERSIHYIENNFREQPGLKEIANHVGLSEYHFQRLFKRWAGISPKQFLKLMTIEYAKELLSESRNLLEVAYASGLSSLGRLHDLFVTVDAVTPAEYREKGKGLEIIYGIHHTPFGLCLLSVTERGICGLSFMPEAGQQQAIENLKIEWSGAKFYYDHSVTETYVNRIFLNKNSSEGPEIDLFLKGTNSQIKIWQALMSIPQDIVLTYSDMTSLLGKGWTVEVVNRAMLTNPVGFLIPCHRIISRIGMVGSYKWGSARKRAMLGWEAARKVKRRKEQYRDDKYLIGSSMNVSEDRKDTESFIHKVE